MGNQINSATNFSAWTYQDLNGDNYTVAGIEQKFSNSKGSLGFLVGAGTDFKDNNLDLVIDGKGTLNYNNNLNQNLRIRTKLKENGQAVQVRYSPISFSANVAKDTSLYGNLHYSGQLNVTPEETKWKNSAGIFVGATQEFGNLSVSVEAQRYNLQNICDNNPKNWAVNLGLSYKF